MHAKSVSTACWSEKAALRIWSPIGTNGIADMARALFEASDWQSDAPVRIIREVHISNASSHHSSIFLTSSPTLAKWRGGQVLATMPHRIAGGNC
jgi:hypothetical protein